MSNHRKRLSQTLVIYRCFFFREVLWLTFFAVAIAAVVFLLVFSIFLLLDFAGVCDV